MSARFRGLLRSSSPVPAVTRCDHLAAAILLALLTARVHRTRGHPWPQERPCVRDRADLSNVAFDRFRHIYDRLDYGSTVAAVIPVATSERVVNRSSKIRSSDCQKTRSSKVHVCLCATRASSCSRASCRSQSMVRRIVVRVPSGEQGLHSSSCCRMMRINGNAGLSQSTSLLTRSVPTAYGSAQPRLRRLPFI